MLVSYALSCTDKYLFQPSWKAFPSPVMSSHFISWHCEVMHVISFGAMSCYVNITSDHVK